MEKEIYPEERRQTPEPDARHDTGLELNKIIK